MPMVVVLYFSITMLLLVAFPLSALKYFLDDTSITTTLEGPMLMAIAAILIGLIYCEISARIKNLLLGSILFGVIASNLFIALLPISSVVLNREIRSIPLNVYLFIAIVGSGLLAAIYHGVKTKKFNET